MDGQLNWPNLMGASNQDLVLNMIQSKCEDLKNVNIDILHTIV